MSALSRLTTALSPARRDIARVTTLPATLADEVRALFAGRVVVASGADPRDVHQIADAIGAVPLPKPHLRADLVRAVTGDSL